MEFRLVYQGRLPAASAANTRAKEKQQLRKHFHAQLRELWKEHGNLREQSEELFVKQRTPPNQVSYPGPNVEEILPVAMIAPTAPVSGGRTARLIAGAKTWVDHIADDFKRCGTRFVPLVRKANGFTCSLDILFLRRDTPGSLVENGGDIDNRIKVLLDGLRMPKTVPELGGVQIDSADEDPFYCLLEDDKLITSISVTTDRLIIPRKAEEDVNDVLLVIHVTVVDPSAIFSGGRLV